MARLLYVREKSTAPWIVNFSKGGWFYRHKKELIHMTPRNTLMWSQDLGAWVSVR